MTDAFFSPLEVKLADTKAPEGVFTGYASVFGNVDAHGDVVMPGAFQTSLAEKKAAGRKVPMHLMHRMLGGDGIPVGVWNRIEEDLRGLQVEGKISGMNTDGGRLLFERVKDGALAGLSIGFKVLSDGVTFGKKATDPRRTLTKVDLVEVSLVDDPCNALTRIDEMKAANVDNLKSTMALVERDKVAPVVAKTIGLYQSTLTGGNSPTAEQRAELFEALCDINEAVTGERMPPGVKSSPQTLREWENALRELGISRSRAPAMAGLLVKAQNPWDEDNAKAKAEREAAAKLAAYLESL